MIVSIQYSYTWMISSPDSHNDKRDGLRFILFVMRNVNELAVVATNESNISFRKTRLSQTTQN